MKIQYHQWTFQEASDSLYPEVQIRQSDYGIYKTNQKILSLVNIRILYDQYLYQEANDSLQLETQKGLSDYGAYSNH